MQRFRVLIRPVEVEGENLFVAQCLEKNIVVRGETPDDAFAAFLERVVQFQVLVSTHGAEDPFSYLEQAPPDAWQAWDDAFKGQTTRLPVNGPIEIEPALAYA